ncbi:MAG TPA: GTP-binding protein [Mycobacteriales bacterium]|jgi:G3E family GTPase|nr:GTP-binding protein [Mycobacteriales bacterium]
MRIITFGGFLGAGKTTTMLALARRLEHSGERVAIITNDQGTDLVDTVLARGNGAGQVAEITGGCFCCRFDDLAEVIVRLRDDADPTVILAEAVGSCTDLQSTVIRPLRHFYGDAMAVSPLTVVVDPLLYRPTSTHWLPLADEPDLAYLYRHQLDEAEVIAVNKADLVPGDEMATVCTEIRHRFPAARVFPVSAAGGTGLDQILSACTGAETADRHAFEIDYDRYGAAEAALAWTNQTFTLRADAGEAFDPVGWVDRLLVEFGRASAESAATIGHVKVLADSGSGVTKASITGGVPTPVFDLRGGSAESAAVTVNARVQTRPIALDELIARSVDAAGAGGTVRAGERTGQVFRPGFPVPIHRM